jgi:hypothetical protein
VYNATYPIGREQQKNIDSSSLNPISIDHSFQFSYYQHPINKPITQFFNSSKQMISKKIQRCSWMYFNVDIDDAYYNENYFNFNYRSHFQGFYSVFKVAIVDCNNWPKDKKEYVSSIISLTFLFQFEFDQDKRLFIECRRFIKNQVEKYYREVEDQKDPVIDDYVSNNTKPEQPTTDANQTQPGNDTSHPEQPQFFSDFVYVLPDPTNLPNRQVNDSSSVTNQFAKYSQMHAVSIFGMRIYDCEKDLISKAMCALGAFYPQESVFKFYECLNTDYDYSQQQIDLAEEQEYKPLLKEIFAGTNL